jgi:glycosyltransferase involved in cell wall biosynthesis
VLVAWDRGVFRTLTAEERGRAGLPPGVEESPRCLIPWNATFVVTEVLRPEEHALAVGCLAKSGVAEVVGIAYDLAALTEPASTRDSAQGLFIHYLDALSAASRLSAISSAVGADFASYDAIFGRLDRPVPAVRTHQLPTDALQPSPADGERAARLTQGWGPIPYVLCVSSLQPRKNHLRTLAAAEQLWASGLAFQLVFVEGTHQSWTSFEELRQRLSRQGRPLRVLSEISDEELFSLYRSARFTVCVSLTEGFGLPIAESLAAGTPAVVTRYGATAEIAAAGGAVLVDPTDVDAIAAAFRELLVDDAFHADLSAAAARRTWPSWDQHSRAVWSWLVDGVDTEQHGGS